MLAIGEGRGGFKRVALAASEPQIGRFRYRD